MRYWDGEGTPLSPCVKTLRWGPVTRKKVSIWWRHHEEPFNLYSQYHGNWRLNEPEYQQQCPWSSTCGVSRLYRYIYWVSPKPISSSNGAYCILHYWYTIGSSHLIEKKLISCEQIQATIWYHIIEQIEFTSGKMLKKYAKQTSTYFLIFVCVPMCSRLFCITE